MPGKVSSHGYQYCAPREQIAKMFEKLSMFCPAGAGASKRSDACYQYYAPPEQVLMFRKFF